MNKRLMIGLTLSAWCLYVASLFLPAVDDSVGPITDSIPVTKNLWVGLFGGLVPGWGVLLLCGIPICWIVVFPFVYLIVNVVFLFSAGSLNLVFLFSAGRIDLLYGRKSTFYTVLISLSAVASWFAPACVGDVGVGYFAWTASITLMAVAILISPNDEESTASLDSEGS